MKSEAVLIVLIVFWTFFMSIKTIFDYRTRKHLIDKGLVNKNVKFLQGFESGYLSSLKWGLVLLGIGGALIITKLADYDFEDEATFGAMFLAAGVGLVVYYFIALFQAKNNPQNNGNGNGHDDGDDKNTLK